ncbi:MAG: hypothetical protein ACKO11_10595 [Cuspidothrix sp.]
MLFTRHSVIAPISLTIALLINSCSEGKISQCQRLIKVVNHGTTLIDTKKGQQVSTSLQLSKDLKNVTQSIQELNLQDPTLQKFQPRFIKVFDNLSLAIAKAANALEETKQAEASSNGKTKIIMSKKQIDSTLTTAAKTVGKESDTLALQLNKYCSQEVTKN